MANDTVDTICDFFLFLIEKWLDILLALSGYYYFWNIYLLIYLFFFFLERNFIEWRKDDEGSRGAMMDDEMR